MTVATPVSTITEHEEAQVQRANASDATPIVFVHRALASALQQKRNQA